LTGRRRKMPELQISTDKIEDFIEAARLGSGSTR
jgi:hypothetical protein